jgi:hypothetical protein
LPDQIWERAYHTETSVIHVLFRLFINGFLYYKDVYGFYMSALVFSRSFALEETRKEADTSLFDKVEAEDLKLKCSTNLVGCHFQLTNHRQVVSLSTDILSNDESSKNVKLLYRRGVSHLVKWR